MTCIRSLSSSSSSSSSFLPLSFSLPFSEYFKRLVSTDSTISISLPNRSYNTKFALFERPIELPITKSASSKRAEAIYLKSSASFATMACHKEEREREKKEEQEKQRGKKKVNSRFLSTIVPIIRRYTCRLSLMTFLRNNGFYLADKTTSRTRIFILCGLSVSRGFSERRGRRKLENMDCEALKSFSCRTFLFNVCTVNVASW